MTNEIILLCATAASIGFIHTLFGPDHYLPFIAISKARNWSLRKTALVTFLCGVGHVASSIVLGFVGILFGIALAQLELFESVRGEIAGWLLMAFGLGYMIWGIRKAIRNKPHRHFHAHALEGSPAVSAHSHVHTHNGEHVHVHGKTDKKKITPWVLFIIFIFGPCEPLIPLLMFPAARESTAGVVLVAAVFSVCTIGTMLAVTLISVFGLKFLPFKRLERYTHAIAGGTILVSGLAIQVLGL